MKNVLFFIKVREGLMWAAVAQGDLASLLTSASHPS